VGVAAASANPEPLGLRKNGRAGGASGEERYTDRVYRIVGTDEEGRRRPGRSPSPPRRIPPAAALGSRARGALSSGPAPAGYPLGPRRARTSSSWTRGIDRSTVGSLIRKNGDLPVQARYEPSVSRPLRPAASAAGLAFVERRARDATSPCRLWSGPARLIHAYQTDSSSLPPAPKDTVKKPMKKSRRKPIDNGRSISGRASPLACRGTGILPVILNSWALAPVLRCRVKTHGMSGERGRSPYAEARIRYRMPTVPS